MDIFEVHRRIMDDYASYISSFVSIADDELRAPIAPAVVWAVRECIRQMDAVSALEKLKGQIENIFADAISRKRTFRELDQLSRNIQDVAFDGRSRNPLFFDFLYNRLRPDHELRMNEKAKEMADSALAKRR